MAMALCHPPEARAKPVAEHAGHAIAVPDDSASATPTKPNPHADAMRIGCIAPSTVRPPIAAARLFDASARVFVPVATGAPLGDRAPAHRRVRPACRAWRRLSRATGLAGSRRALFFLASSKMTVL